MSTRPSRQPTPGPSHDPETGITTLKPPRQGTDERFVWNKYFEEDNDDPAHLNPEELSLWQAYRDNYILQKATERLSLKDTAETIVVPMADDTTLTAKEQNKLYSKAVADPGGYDGDRPKFDTWWKAVQLYLKGYVGANDITKIAMVVSRLDKGEANAWAQTKRDELIDDMLTNWTTFSQELQERFSDPGRIAKIQNDIHNFIQGRMSAHMYIDKFEILKATSKTPEATALYLLQRGLSREIIDCLYGSKEGIPGTYKGFVQAVQVIGQNLDTTKSLRKALAHPEIRQSNVLSYHNQHTGSGNTYGGMGKPMEIDKMSMNCQGCEECSTTLEIDKVTSKTACFNCGKEGHWTKDCNQPKRRPKCYNCNKEGHFTKDCKQAVKKKQFTKGKFKPNAKNKGKFKKRGRIHQCQEGDESDQENDPEEGENHEQSENSSDEEVDEQDFQE